MSEKDKEVALRQLYAFMVEKASNLRRRFISHPIYAKLYTEATLVKRAELQTIEDIELTGPLICRIISGLMKNKDIETTAHLTENDQDVSYTFQFNYEKNREALNQYKDLISKEDMELFDKYVSCLGNAFICVLKLIPSPPLRPADQKDPKGKEEETENKLLD